MLIWKVLRWILIVCTGLATPFLVLAAAARGGVIVAIVAIVLLLVFVCWLWGWARRRDEEDAGNRAKR